jgi:hypothetical protein
VGRARAIEKIHEGAVANSYLSEQDRIDNEYPQSGSNCGRRAFHERYQITMGSETAAQLSHFKADFMGVVGGILWQGSPFGTMRRRA